MTRNSIATLPQAIAASIFGFVAVDERQELTTDAVVPIPTALVPLALVAREWHALVWEIHCHALLQSLHVLSWSKTRRDVLDVRRQLTLRSRVLRRLDVFDLAAADACGLWGAALAQAPRLTALRVYGVDVGYASAQLVEIVRAAGRHCPRIERLELPPFVNRKPSYPAYQQASHREEDQDEVEDCPALDRTLTPLSNEEAPDLLIPTPRRDATRELVAAVVESASAWKRHQRVGLRHLCLSTHDLLTGLSAANAYVSQLAENCPGLEVLDGYQAMHTRSGQGEKWTIDLATWETFTRSCTQLSEFNWLPVPFATRFFEIFGRYNKPNLTKLTIAATDGWNWAKYTHELDENDHSELVTTGFAAQATDPHTMLRACPNLTTLEVQCFFPAGDLANLMDVNQFGDLFCETLATHCPKLTSLAIVPRYGYWARPGSITTFTDRSMITLAQLPLLRTVNVTGANITGDGLYTLVVDHARAFRGLREYEIRIGHVYNGAELVDFALFYKVLERFLVRLANETRDLVCLGCRATLRLYNEGGARRLDELWLKQYLEKNEELRKRIQARHLGVTIQQTDKGLVHWGIRDFACSINI